MDPGVAHRLIRGRHRAYLVSGVSQPAAAKPIGRSVLLAINAFTDADNQDALTVLRALRTEILRVG